MEADGDFCAVGEAGAPVAPFFGAADAGVAGEAFAVNGWCGADEADPGVQQGVHIAGQGFADRCAKGAVAALAGDAVALVFDGFEEGEPVVPELMPVPRSMVAWRLSGGWVVVMAVLFVKVMVEFRLCR